MKDKNDKEISLKDIFKKPSARLWLFTAFAILFVALVSERPPEEQYINSVAKLQSECEASMLGEKNIEYKEKSGHLEFSGVEKFPNIYKGDTFPSDDQIRSSIRMSIIYEIIIVGTKLVSNNVWEIWCSTTGFGQDLIYATVKRLDDGYWVIFIESSKNSNHEIKNADNYNFIGKQ